MSESADESFHFVDVERDGLAGLKVRAAVVEHIELPSQLPLLKVRFHHPVLATYH
jgi:hypothetical protein